MISARISSLSFSAILIAVVTVLFSSCIKYEEVQMLGVQGVNLQKFAADGAEIAVTVKIKNPNNYAIKVVGSDLELFVKDQSAGKGKLKGNVTIPKNSTENHVFVIEADYKEVMRVAKANIMNMFGGGIQINVKGHIKVRAKFIGKKVPINFKHNVNLKDMQMPF